MKMKDITHGVHRWRPRRMAWHLHVYFIAVGSVTRISYTTLLKSSILSEDKKYS